MPYRRVTRKPLITALLFLLCISISLPSWAENPSKDDPLKLRRIMQELDQDMQSVTRAISREDWEAVALIAPRIADHPQPPLAEKARILNFVGRDAGKFRGYDKQTHEAASAMQKAAMQEDGRQVITEFSRIQNSCLSCHQDFRKPFVEHFYVEH